VAYSVTTGGDSLFHSCAAAIAFFERDFWKGPKPRADTILEVHLIGSHGFYRVRAGRVNRMKLSFPRLKSTSDA
jgi:hypothetical protein